MYVDYIGYTLIANFSKGKFRGHLKKDKRLILEIEGTSIEDVLSKLKNEVDAELEGVVSPEASKYIGAFSVIRGDIHDGQFAMLKAHHNAPDRAITATQLAKAASYDHWSSANLHYGLLGQMLCDELNLKPHLATHAIATEKENGTDKGEWLWIMRPEVAEAVEYLGLNE